MMWSKLFQDSIYSTIDILEKFRLIINGLLLSDF